MLNTSTWLIFPSWAFDRRQVQRLCILNGPGELWDLHEREEVATETDTGLPQPTAGVTWIQINNVKGTDVPELLVEKHVWWTAGNRHSSLSVHINSLLGIGEKAAANKHGCCHTPPRVSSSCPPRACSCTRCTTPSRFPREQLRAPLSVYGVLLRLKCPSVIH